MLSSAHSAPSSRLIPDVTEATKNGHDKKKENSIYYFSMTFILNTSSMYFHSALIKPLIMSYVCNAISSDLKFVIRHVK